MQGRLFGRYRVDAKLGEGGMGVVWKAHDPQLGRDIALKVLPDTRVADPESRARLLREARAAAALNHPRILTVYDVGEADGHVYIAMEYVPGRPLSQVVASGGMPAAEVLRLGEQVASALAHAHERGIVHRDIKPSNVLLTTNGDAKVLDFGLATWMVTDQGDTRSLGLTQEGSLVGTPDALAPELWRGARADPPSDVWAFGVLLFGMLTGASPFRGRTTYELSTAICTTDPPPLPEQVPAALRALVTRCLARDPQRRFRSASELHAEIAALAAAGAPAGGATDAAAPRRRVPAPVAVGSAVVLLAAVAAFMTLGRGSRPGAARPIESLAVLPLDNFSRDADEQYFADGMTEELITRLAQLGIVRVISRTSVMRFRGSTLSLPVIAHQLGVDAVVVGSVEQVGGRVRVTAQLVRAATDEHLWARSYDRQVGDALALQDEVAAAIAHEVRGTLAASTPAARPSPAPTVPRASSTGVPAAAVQAYLRGRDEYQRWTVEGSVRALRFYDQALSIDSTFTAARASRAAALLYVSASPETVALARAAIARAMAEAPGLGEAHAALAKFLFEHDWDWSGAEREFRRAIELNPNDADAHHQYSHLLAALGRVSEASEQASLMQQLDPLASASVDHRLWLDYVCGRFRESEALFHQLVAQDPGYVQCYSQFLDVLMVTNRWDDFRSLVEEARQRGLALDPLLGDLAAAMLRGQLEEAARVVHRMAAQPDPDRLAAGDAAAILAVLGRREDAFAQLDSAYARRDYRLLFTNLDPAYASLRSDPRYTALRRGMRLPQ